MATQAHCAFCFETLAANFEHRQPLSLAQVEELWERYHAGKNKTGVASPEDSDYEDAEEGEHEAEDAEMTDADADADTDAGAEAEADVEEPPAAKPAAISRLLNRDTSAASSSSSLPSTRSGASSTTNASRKASSGADTPASSSSSSVRSRSSLFSFARRRRSDKSDEKPLFVTWNTVSRGGHKSLRGCIGTFEPQEIEAGLRSYALTSAFEDVRFQPIPASLLPTLTNHVTLLTNFSTPTKDPLDWTLGTHGLRISFTHHGRRYGATYLPDVAREQGWTKEETLVSLMRKAGWNGGGAASAWARVWREGKGELVRYEGKQVGLGYAEWRAWRDWVEGEEGVKSKPLN